MRISKSSRRMLLLMAGAVVAVVPVALYFTLREAQVSGGTPSERIAAIHRIVAERPRGGGKALARAAAEDPSPLVRAEAMAALGLKHFLAPEHRGVIEKGTADSDVRVRAVAAETLGRYGDKPAADVLTKLIRPDQDERITQGALHGLAGCDVSIAIVTLLETADKGSSRAVKLVAMKGLLRKFKAKIPDGRDPDKAASWRDLVHRWKRSPTVRKAYADEDKALNYQPKYILGKDHHGDRHELP